MSVTSSAALDISDADIEKMAHSNSEATPSAGDEYTSEGDAPTDRYRIFEIY